MVALALATACLGHDDERAAALYAKVTTRHDLREAWVGLAAARRRLGDRAGAAEALAAALRRHVVAPGFGALADAIARECGAPGWLGVGRRGAVEEHIVSRKERGEPAEVSHLIGFPIDTEAIATTFGCVSAQDGALVGWAWHPGDPDTDPVLTIRPVTGGSRGLMITASDLSTQVANGGLLARPRGFTIPSEAMTGMRGALRVLGRDGKDLLGSPLDPRAEWDAGVAAAAALASRYPAGRGRQRTPRTITPMAMPVAMQVPPVAHAGARRRPEATVIIPVYGAMMQALACIDSVLASGQRPLVIDDASPEQALAGALDDLMRRGHIRLIRNRRNLGFPATANLGMRSLPESDVVLLNSDTLVASGWLDELRHVAYAVPDIGTVTPLSNDATILSYPNVQGGNAVPDMATTVRLDAMARRTNGGAAIEIPVGVGFCLYVKRACLDDVGAFRDDVFAQGYGEENDFCLRARHRGWRNVAAPGAFVAHVGGHSFGSAGHHLRARNEVRLERLHPGYGTLIDAHIVADSLSEVRRRLDLARWRGVRRRGGQSVVLISHVAGGGVERQISASVARHRGDGHRAIVVRPSHAPDGSHCATVSDGTENGFPNLRYRLPDELPALQRLLAAERPIAIELHHLVGHHPSIADLPVRMGVPYDIYVHDYAWLCARVALVGPAGRYCGEPKVSACEACVADAGNLIDEDIPVAALRQRSARLLAGARRVFTPSEDAAARIRRHFPRARPVVRPHEDDTAMGELGAVARRGRSRICVIGAIGIHKGYQVVLDCARDAAERGLPLEFVVVGHTIDDRRLMATERVFVTGEFAPDEAIPLIRAQRATLALLPSIFPETWCLSLGEAWRAGLRVAAFDIGAQAERIRRTGRGFLMPLGLPPQVINNTLIAASGLSAKE
jgi:GT2 family glycosyltransferase/glycosyltransferase involved in cell wall biosynthesis